MNATSAGVSVKHRNSSSLPASRNLRRASTASSVNVLVAKNSVPMDRALEASLTSVFPGDHRKAPLLTELHTIPVSPRRTALWSSPNCEPANRRYSGSRTISSS